jgi:GTPase SAR1 family protein
MEKDERPLYNLVLLGPPKSGKTSLARRLVYALPKPEGLDDLDVHTAFADKAPPYEKTLGLQFFDDVSVVFPGSENRRVRFTEIGGSTPVQNVPSALQRTRADVFVLCFDMNDSASFEAMCRVWLPCAFRLVTAAQTSETIKSYPFIAIAECSASTSHIAAVLSRRRKFRYVLDMLFEPNQYQYFAFDEKTTISRCKQAVATMLEQAAHQRRPRIIPDT